jgi:hypothetical protein
MITSGNVFVAYGDFNLCRLKIRADCYDKLNGLSVYMLKKLVSCRCMRTMKIHEYNEITHVPNVYIRTQDIMDIKYNRIITLIQLWYKSVNHSGPILQFGEYVHTLLMISILFHANIVSLCS